MSNQTQNSGNVFGGLLFVIALVLLIAGYAMESSEYDVELGSLLFTIGFWLMMIPLIILGFVLIILALAFIASDR